MRLHAARFDTTTQSWRVAEDAAPVTMDTLSCMTFNVWFDDLAFERRTAALLKLIADSNLDLVALQEVTPRLLEHLLADEHVRATFALSDHRGATVWPYGVLLLTRWAPQRLTLHKLPSEMGRRLLVAEWRINGQHTAVATVHLESLRASSPMRATQLAQIFPTLARSAHSLLVGDFNFCSAWLEEQARLDPAYIDVWPLLRPDEPGYTEDTAVNLMRLKHRGREKQVRFDRVLLRSPVPGWTPATIELVGDAPVGTDAPELFPSDHFGLRARFSWSDAPLPGNSGIET